MLDKRSDVCKEKEEEPLELTLHKVYDFALTSPPDEIRFILESARLNKAAAEISFERNYGHELGKMLRGKYEHEIMGKMFSHAFFLIPRERVMHGWRER